jgi:hypothetical protein
MARVGAVVVIVNAGDVLAVAPDGPVQVVSDTVSVQV